MYNIHSHYENIWSYLNTIITDPRLLYLMPYGSTQPENLEFLAKNMSHNPGPRGPLFIFYDQEPILGEYNFRLLDHIRDNYMGPFILVTTEKNSTVLDSIKERYSWPTVYYFHHIFAAHDWFRGYRYDSNLVEPADRVLTKKYISFNRLTSNARVYRSVLISKLIKEGILSQGHVSYNDVCPDSGLDYAHNLALARDNNLISSELFTETVANISKAPLPLRIDYRDYDTIPNHSFVLSAVPETQESFCYVVTETCFWEQKHHLTEKIFKPIISKMPFLLIGCQHNLAYLKEYGFKTFSNWWDESYDDIEDPVLRLNAAVDTLKTICNYDLASLQTMLNEMNEVLQHNYDLFYSHSFLDSAWKELTDNLSQVVPR